MKIKLTVLICIVTATLLHSQDAVQNLRKYWFYRDRLVNNFMLVGDCQGCSLVAEIRNDELHFGDAVLDLGTYIGILGTEYKLLKDNNQNTQRTEEELYYALKAFNRLDQNAETYYQTGGNFGSASLNGFFVRDDAPSDFVSSHFAHFNNSTYSGTNDFGSQYTNVSITASNFADLPPSPNTNNVQNEESIDQVIGLLVGLALAKECVDGNATFNGMNLLSEVKQITNRVISYIQGDYWLIKNPITGLNVDRGHNGTFLSAGILDAAQFIDNSINMDIVSSNPILVANWQALNNLPCGPIITPAVNIPWWSPGNGPVTYNPGSNQIQFHAPDTTLTVIQSADLCSEDEKILHMAAVGNSWPGDIALLHVDLCGRSFNQNYEHIPLILKVLHNQGSLCIDNHISHYEALLDAAPCRGPNNYGDSIFDSWEYSTTNRIRNANVDGPNGRGRLLVGNGPQKGEYCGIDYMLLFNLYCLANDSYLTSYFPIQHEDENISTPFPLTILGTQIGSVTHPLHVITSESIVSISHIAADGDVTFKAGTTINMLPGFSTEVGAHFEAILENIECDANHLNYVRLAGTIKESTDPSVENSMSVVQPNNAGENPATINVYPNPSQNGKFTVTSGSRSSMDILITDLTGRTIYTQHVEEKNTFDIDISNYSKGIYCMRVISKSETRNFKLIFD